MRPRTIFLLLVLASIRLAGAASEDAGLAFFRDLAETRNYTLGRPIAPKIVPDGRHALYLRSGPRDPTLRLYEFDLGAGKERELLTPAQLLAGAEEKLSAEEKARRERQRQTLKGFTSFQLSADGYRVLVSLSGKLYLVDRETLKIDELPGTGWLDPRFSPDGNFVAAVGRDRELHVIDLGTSQPGKFTPIAERAVTQGATATLAHGLAEFVAQEEMSRHRGHWWSPDGETLLVQETDEAMVEVRHIADPLHPEAPPEKFFYPRAGTPNAVVRLLLVPRTGDAKPLPVEWDTKAFPYLAHVSWPPSGPLTILVQNREQTEQRLMTVDPTTGLAEDLLRQSDTAWVNLDDNSAGSTGERRPPLWLADGQRFLWTTEHRGAWQVELLRADGRLLREITPVTFRYRNLIGVDEITGTVWVRGSLDPRSAEVWSFPIGGGAGEAFTAGPGVHDAQFFPEPEILVQTIDRFDGTWRTEIVDANGKVVAVLPSVAESPAHWPATELTRTRGTPAFDAAVTRPRDFVAGKKYPVLLQVYAGPTGKYVTANRRSYFTDQWMADRGYIVVRVDGRGTPGHGREWERAIKGNLIDLALADQIAGLQALAREYSELDLSRVGVAGWSFGGYFATMAVARRPDIFHAAVAGAPVVTWENYDTHYTERYLGLPSTAPEAYRTSNVTTYAAQLSRPLLLIHGLTDDNVYVQHTLQLADALFLAGKRYEFLPMLGTHLVSDPLVRLRQQTRIAEFFDRELKAPSLR